MRDAFVCWMESLDPVAVARTNSFHSAAHKAMVKKHEERKAKGAKVLTFDGKPEERTKPAPKPKSKSIRTYHFTTEQIAVAERWAENTGKLSITGLDLNSEVI